MSHNFYNHKTIGPGCELMQQYVQVCLIKVVREAGQVFLTENYVTTRFAATFEDKFDNRTSSRLDFS